MERSLSMAFAAGALVFPGGATDADDHELASSMATDLPIDEAASRIGAIRETLEESGIAPGIGISDPRILAELRRELEKGTAFSALVQAHGLSLDLDALIPFARWSPSPEEHVRRVFDARFYLARHDPEGPDASVDDTEHVRLFWETAAGVLARCAAGQGRVIYPTRRNLERLAQFGSVEALEDHARGIAVEKIVPWLEERPDGHYLCIPGHLGYPTCEERVDTALRG